MRTSLQLSPNGKISLPCCPLCHLQYDPYYHIPRILPKCGHTYCQKCLTVHIQTKINRKLFVCGQCSTDLVIRKAVANDLPKNIGILDIIKDLKKQSFEMDVSCVFNDNRLNGSGSSFKQTKQSKKGDASMLQNQEFCHLHQNMQLDMVCETCAYQKVCSKCVLLDKDYHHDHKFVDKMPILPEDLQQMREVFQIVQDTVEKTIFPNSEFNILKKSTESVVDGLKKTIRIHFQQSYYSLIRKKQEQFIKQIEQIKVEGKMQNKAEEILKVFDCIKGQYQNMQSSQSTNLSIKNVEAIVQECKNLHNQIQEFSESTEKAAASLKTQLSNKIYQSRQFRIQEIRYGLKSIFQVKKEKLQSKIKSPAKKIDTKQKAMKSSPKSERQGLKTAQKKPQLLNRQTEALQRHTHRPPKQNAKQSACQISLGEALQLPIGQKKKPSSSIFFVNKKTAKEVSQTQRPPKSNIFSKQKHEGSTMNQTVRNNVNSESESLKINYIRPSKELSSFEQRSKYNTIVKQVQRQAKNQTLELIGLQISDSLLVHICEFLRTKQLSSAENGESTYRFDNLKLVKNSITDEGLSTLLGFLIESDSEIQVLNLTSNLLTSKCLPLLEELSQRNRFLKSVYLSHNKISTFQLKSKQKAFESNGIDVNI